MGVPIHPPLTHRLNIHSAYHLGERQMDATTREKLVAGLRAAVGEAKPLRQTAAAESDEHLRDVGDSAREAVSEIDEQVRRNPWAAVAIAAGVGLLLGLLLVRKSPWDC